MDILNLKFMWNSRVKTHPEAIANVGVDFRRLGENFGVETDRFGADWISVTAE